MRVSRNLRTLMACLSKGPMLRKDVLAQLGVSRGQEALSEMRRRGWAEKAVAAPGAWALTAGGHREIAKPVPPPERLFKGHEAVLGGLREAGREAYLERVWPRREVSWAVRVPPSVRGQGSAPPPGGSMLYADRFVWDLERAGLLEVCGKWQRKAAPDRLAREEVV